MIRLHRVAVFGAVSTLVLVAAGVPAPGSVEAGSSRHPEPVAVREAAVHVRSQTAADDASLGWATVELPGTARELLAVIGLDAAVPQALVVPAVIRTIHHALPGRSAAADAQSAAVANHLRAAAASGASVRVPLPLSPVEWEGGLVADADSTQPLATRILGDRAASWLYLAFSSMEPGSARRLAAALPAAVLRRHAAVLAGVAGALTISASGVEVPGGAAAIPLWESLVGEQPTAVRPFVERLLDRDEGVLAHFFHTVAILDLPRQRFALHLASATDATRAGRFRALYEACLHSEPSWRPRAQPLMRPSFDGAMLLALAEVTEDGLMAGPSEVALWTRVFDPAFRASGPLPSEGGPASLDAAALAGLMLVRADPGGRRGRFESLLFAQRAFRGARSADWPGLAPILKQFESRRALLLVLERLGFSDPGAYAAAIASAVRLDRITDPNDRTAALSQFQSTLALIDRVAAAGRLDRQLARRLAEESLAVLPGLNGRYDGRMADWMARRLLPDIRRALPDGLAGAPDEEAVLHALAPPPLSPRASAVTWEGHHYRVDLESAEAARMRAVRAKLGGASLDAALAFARLTMAFVYDPGSVERARTLAERIAQACDAAGAVSLPSRPAIPAAAIREAGSRTTDLASRLSGTGDLRRTLAAGPLLWPIADALLAESLAGLAYAAELGDPDAFLLASVNPVATHDFAFATARNGAPGRPLAWEVPRPVTGEGRQWRVAGSLLALDLALSESRLRRLSPELPPRPPRINANDRQTFVDSLALLQPRSLDDATAAAIAGGLSRGRARIVAGARDRARLAVLAAEAGADLWRRNAASWTAGEQPDQVLAVFSLADQLRLGAPDLQQERLAGWGMSTFSGEGALRLRYPARGRAWILGGRASLGLGATQIPDLHLRVTAELSERGLPAALAPWVLAYALNDFLDDVQPIDADDWLTPATFARDLPSSRFEDYVAALTARGPLVPVDGDR